MVLFGHAIHSPRIVFSREVLFTYVFTKLVSQKDYDIINAKIADASESLVSASMKKVAIEENIIDGTANFVVVSGDGTWMTRVHTSPIRVCPLIGAHCGNVIEMEVMSSFRTLYDSCKRPTF
ncbi:hypothetical protein TNCV_3452361 [Trichonephila clavipes]|nr:hypothetical protein TNCV_3452361 [Trichonephila clavipes]